MTAKQSQPRPVVLVPKKYAGQWIAWNRDRQAIIGHGGSLRDAQASALAASGIDPEFEWVPPADRRIIGIGR